MTTISEGPRSVDRRRRRPRHPLPGRSSTARYVDAVSGETFDCVSPITGEVVAQVAAGDSADVDRAVAGARAAFESGAWSRLAPKKRKRVLQQLAGADVRARRGAGAARDDRHGQADPRRRRTSTSRSRPSASRGTARRSTRSTTRSRRPGPTRTCRSCASRSASSAPSCRGTSRSSWPRGSSGRRSRPGNSVVLKPAEQSPLTALRLAELAVRGRAPRRRPPGRPRLRRDRRAGARPPPRRRHDRLHGLDRGRQALPPLLGRVEHEARRARVRRQVAAHRDAASAATSTRPRTAVAWGVFYNQGEVCNAGSRLLVHSSGEGRAAREGRRRSPTGSRRATRSTRRRGWARSSTRPSSTRVLGYIESGQERGRRRSTSAAAGSARTPAATTSSRRSSTPSRTT